MPAGRILPLIARHPTEASEDFSGGRIMCDLLGLYGS